MKINYINIYGIKSIVPHPVRSDEHNKGSGAFISVDWVVRYGEYLSESKYHGADWKVYDFALGRHRGQVCLFPELASLYLEWITGASGWDLKRRVVELIYPTSKLYVLRSGKFIKIGITQNLQSRLSTIQNATPFDVVLLVSNDFRDAKKHEQKLHIKYAQHRRKGEWFDLPDEKLGELIEYVGKGDGESLSIPQIKSEPKLEQLNIPLCVV